MPVETQHLHLRLFRLCAVQSDDFTEGGRDGRQVAEWSPATEPSTVRPSKFILPVAPTAAATPVWSGQGDGNESRGIHRVMHSLQPDVRYVIAAGTTARTITRLRMQYPFSCYVASWDNSSAGRSG